MLAQAFVVALLILVILYFARNKILSLITKIMMTKYRFIFVILVVLPVSTIYDMYFYMKNKYIFWTRKAVQDHDKLVRYVQEQVRAYNECGSNKPMCTARSTKETMSLRISKHKDNLHKIDISALHNILEIDEKNGIVRVEPLVTCGQLTATLNPLGWTIPVVPELDDLTIGGLVSGFGVETSSHRYGLFQAQCVAYEIVTANGDLLRCTATENSDLFYAIPWSHGTLGFLVAIEIRLIKCTKYVHLKYYPCYSWKSFIEKLNEVIKTDALFVEGLVFSEKEGVVMAGTMAHNVKPEKINEIGRYYKPWFYEHARSFLKKGEGDEYIPLRDYYHRHTKSIFWEMEEIIPFGNHPIFRYLLGWMIPPKISFLKMTTTKELYKQYEEHHVIQDMLVPISTLERSLQVFHDTWRVYPLWVCPMKLFKTPVRGFVNPTQDKDEMFVDIGAYGVPKVANFEMESSHRKVEAYVREVKGFQALYADTFMTREEFYQMFDHTNYNKLRIKYNCTKAFPVVYDKISKHARQGLQTTNLDV